MDTVAGVSVILHTTDGSPSGDPVSICELVEAAAAANRLPFEFFARVIWQESRFRSDAWRVADGEAQGIARFMPMTAAERLCAIPSIRLRPCLSRPNSCGSAPISSAISD
jgi:Transglycosylase SLT domain